jgi:hypothetical protein
MINNTHQALDKSVPFEPFIDPIVAEVRAIRAEISRECGYSVAEIIRRANLVTLESARASLNVPPEQRNAVLYGAKLVYPSESSAAA